MPNHELINYVEFPSKDLEVTKAFFLAVFGWRFVASTEHGSALIVFYSNDLERTEQKITAAAGEIIKPIFPFPGGRRFHFSDPNGNEYAAWSDKGL